MRKSVLGVLACLLAAAPFPRPAMAGMVLLTDGTTLVGVVQLSGTGEPKVQVQVAGKGLRMLKLTDFKAAYFDARGEVGTREADGVPWSKTEVGDSKHAGIADINGTKVTMKDGSDGFRIGRARRAEEPPTDSCCFVFQKLQGDGEITAKVLPSEQTKWARGGLMICEGLDGTGPFAMLSRTADPVAATLLTRLRPGEPIITTPDAKNVNLPSVWLKLTRTAGILKGFESLDGLKWTPVGEKKIAMDEAKGVYIGVAATGNAREGTVSFEAIKLSGKRSVPGLTNVGDSRLPDVSLVLQDGTVLAGSVESISGTGEAKLKRAGSGEIMTVPVSTMARAQFAPLTRAQTQKFLTSSTGILTREGDFLEGDIKDMKADGVTVSSITFGLTTMEKARVFGLVFPSPSDVKPESGLTEIRLMDGSVLMARKISLDKEQLVLEEPLLGTMKINLKELLSMERK